MLSRPCVVLALMLALFTSCNASVSPPASPERAEPVARITPAPRGLAGSTPNAATGLAESASRVAGQGLAELAIHAQPAGASVLIDGKLAGTSPLTISVAPGARRLELSAPGFDPLAETLTLAAGQHAVYEPLLTDVVSPTVRLSASPATVAWYGRAQVLVQATDNDAIAEMQLLLDDELLGASDAGQFEFELIPAEIEGLAAGSTYTLVARVVDNAGNLGSASVTIAIEAARPNISVAGPSPSPTRATPATPRPTAPPNVAAARPTATRAAAIPSPVTPAARPPSADVATIVVSSVVIPTYPYAAFLQDAVDEGLDYPYPLRVLDRAAYQASYPRAEPKTYVLIVMENRYLRLSVLPQLGGRIYEVFYKPTGHNELYRNPVIMPTDWGPANPPYPAGADWWLAVGGIEWGFPVEEHGYEWGQPWGYEPLHEPDGTATTTVFTSDYRRPYVSVKISLPPDAAYFAIEPHITNPLAQPFRMKWWTNAMVAPGGTNVPGPDLRFYFGGNEVAVHSTGDISLPQAGQIMPWPHVDGRDMSRLGNWGGWLGFFEYPAAHGPFSAVYDTAADEGLVRVYPADVTRGAKGFGMGWTDPISASDWTDESGNGTGYVEMHGGLAPNFDDWVTLAPGASLTWSETWYPLAGLGGVTHAAAGGALYLERTEDKLRLRLAPTQPVMGKLMVTVQGLEPIVREVDLAPDRPFDEELTLSSPLPALWQVSVSLIDSAGTAIYEYQSRQASTDNTLYLAAMYASCPAEAVLAMAEIRAR